MSQPPPAPEESASMGPTEETGRSVIRVRDRLRGMKALTSELETDATLEVLRQTLISDMTQAERDLFRRHVVIARSQGQRVVDICERYPLIPAGIVRRWAREAAWEPVDTSPEAVALNREIQARECRAMIHHLWDKIDRLENSEDADTDVDSPEAAADRALKATDALVKLSATLKSWQERESKLLGLDRPVRVEHSGRIQVDFDPALEQLVAELAGGGMLLSGPEDIMDADITGED